MYGGTKKRFADSAGACTFTEHKRFLSIRPLARICRTIVGPATYDALSGLLRYAIKNSI